MKAEEYLDHLIDQYISKEKSPFSTDETIAPALGATKMLVQLREIVPPPEFAHYLELSLRAHIRSLKDEV